MELSQLIQMQLARGATHAGLLFARAGVQVLGALSVAAAYRRAYRLSRDFRRLPA